MEETPEHGSERRNASAGGKHHDVGVFLIGEEHLRAHWPSDKCIVTLLHVADVGGAHAAVDHLRVRELRVRAWLHVGVLAPAHAVDLNHALHAERNGLVGLIVAGRRGGDGVETDLGRLLAFLVWAWRYDTDGLTLEVRHLLVVAHDHVGCLPVAQGRPRCDGLVGDHGALVRCLGPEQVPGNLLALHDTHALLLHRSGAARHGTRTPARGGGHEQSTRHREGSGGRGACARRRSTACAAGQHSRRSGEGLVSAPKADRTHSSCREHGGEGRLGVRGRHA
mmetsp:Transcript_31118/g.97631  ORF Transcript_31118/g.97631 Transcript_31118/m.97631 type:complete len:280 (+) Transcript_31118:543-1382(+)